MRTTIFKISFIAIFCVLCFSCADYENGGFSEADFGIKIRMPEILLPMVKQVSESFMKTNPEINIDLEAAVTKKCIRKFMNGEYDMICTLRKLSEDEISESEISGVEYSEFVISYDEGNSLHHRFFNLVKITKRPVYVYLNHESMQKKSVQKYFPFFLGSVKSECAKYGFIPTGDTEYDENLSKIRQLFPTSGFASLSYCER